jgi:cobaltochelatase CobT
VSDSAVSFLIDCSGSMRQHIESVAILVDVMARALDQIGVTTEVLGFTTNAWNGGRAQKAWLRAGRPPHPGRLNETAHLVFKDSDTLGAAPAPPSAPCSRATCSAKAWTAKRSAGRRSGWCSATMAGACCW